MLGDSAIAVNADDARYKGLIGKKAIVPLINREIPIIADSYVKPDFGTGALKVTPVHDPSDFKMGKRHNLGIVNIFMQESVKEEREGEERIGDDLLYLQGQFDRKS